MKPVYVNLFGDTALVEDVPAGTVTLELRLSKREEPCLAAQLARESYEVSFALEALFLAGRREAEAACPPPRTRQHRVRRHRSEA